MGDQRNSYAWKCDSSEKRIHNHILVEVRQALDLLERRWALVILPWSSCSAHEAQTWNPWMLEPTKQSRSRFPWNRSGLRNGQRKKTFQNFQTKRVHVAFHQIRPQMFKEQCCFDMYCECTYLEGPTPYGPNPTPAQNGRDYRNSQLWQLCALVET